MSTSPVRVVVGATVLVVSLVNLAVAIVEVVAIVACETAIVLCVSGASFHVGDRDASLLKGELALLAGEGVHS